MKETLWALSTDFNPSGQVTANFPYVPWLFAPVHMSQLCCPWLKRVFLASFSFNCHQKASIVFNLPPTYKYIPGIPFLRMIFGIKKSWISAVQEAVH